jgi:hypothetical protein
MGQLTVVVDAKKKDKDLSREKRQREERNSKLSIINIF